MSLISFNIVVFLIWFGLVF